MKRLGIAVAALLLAAAPASAQHRGGGGGGGFHGGGSFHGGGGFHSGGGFRGGFHGGGGFRGGFRGGFGYRGYYGPGFGFGCCGYYDPFYYAPYYYGAPYYPDYGYDDGYGAPPPPPPPPPPDQQGYNQPPPPQQEQSPWHVTQREGETDFELPGDVLFDLDSANVSRDADKVLQEIADAAQDSPRAQLVVEGHTDTSGTHEHNQALSDARARAVADVLSREGVARDRIRTEGMGEAGLAVQTGDGVREARNRRVVVRLINGNMSRREEDPRDDRGPPPN